MMKDQVNEIMIVVKDEECITKAGDENTTLEIQHLEYTTELIIKSSFQSVPLKEKSSYKLTTFIKWRGKIYKSQHFKYTVN